MGRWSSDRIPCKIDIGGRELIMVERVEIDGKILEKPGNEQEAEEMLSTMAGREHFVHSGVAILGENGETLASFFETTTVEFLDISKSDIENYIRF